MQTHAYRLILFLSWVVWLFFPLEFWPKFCQSPGRARVNHNRPLYLFGGKQTERTNYVYGRVSYHESGPVIFDFGFFLRMFFLPIYAFVIIPYVYLFCCHFWRTIGCDIYIYSIYLALWLALKLWVCLLCGFSNFIVII